MDIYERIDMLLNERGLTKRQMCLEAGIPYNSYITSYRRRSDKMMFDTLKAISNFFNVTIEFLLNTDDVTSTIIGEDIDIEHFSTYQKLNIDGKKKVTQYAKDIQPSYPRKTIIEKNNTYNNDEAVRMLPLYDYPASAGRGIFVGQGEYELAEVPDEAPASTSFGIRISGESMEPEIPDGSIVWVRQQSDVYEGQICIVVINDEGYCKVRGDRIFESINRNYKDIVPDI